MMTEVDPQWRLQVMARLTAERTYLLRHLWRLDEAVLCTYPLHDGWMAKDLLPHLGIWDAFHTDRISKVINGRVADIQEFGDAAKLQAYNQAQYEQYKHLPLDTALAVALKERSSFYAMLARVPEADLHRRIRLPWGWRSRIRVWVRQRWRHDAAHGQELARWRRRLPREAKGIGPKSILRALFKSTQREFLAAAAFIADEERTIRPVCGVWTLKDLIGHLTDWEQVGIGGLRQLVAGQAPQFEREIPDFDHFNQANAAARQEQPWEAVWADFTETRQTLLTLFDALPAAQLASSFATPWGSTLTGYVWVSIWWIHEHEHTLDVRRALALSGWPQRLWRP